MFLLIHHRDYAGCTVNPSAGERPDMLSHLYFILGLFIQTSCPGNATHATCLLERMDGWMKGWRDGEQDFQEEQKKKSQNEL